MATLVERAIGAARLDPATYEEVEADTNALGQAMTVVVVAALASGIGASGGHGFRMIPGVIGALVGWFVWALTVYVVGTRLLPQPETKADLGELLRTTGFAAAPGVVSVLGLLPIVGGLAMLVAWLWQLAAMVVAVRQALDYTTTGHAVAVCVIGFIAQMVVVFALVTLVFGSAFMVGSALSH